MKFKSLIVSVFVVALFLGLGTSQAKAITMAEIQAQITALLVQLAQLQGQSGGGGGGSVAPSCPTLSYNLKFGDRDSRTNGEVTKLQSYLANKYGLNRADYVTGYFGRGTQGLVSRLQGDYGLPVTGWLGEDALMKISAAKRAELNIV